MSGSRTTPEPRRTNLWFCHECQAEMIPLRTPDPQCSNCQGSFVEEIEQGDDPSSDPRQFDPPNNGPGLMFGGPMPRAGEASSPTAESQTGSGPGQLMGTPFPMTFFQGASRSQNPPQPGSQAIHGTGEHGATTSQTPGQGGQAAVFYRFTIGPEGARVVPMDAPGVPSSQGAAPGANPNDNNPAGGQGGQGNPLTALMRAFGWNPPNTPGGQNSASNADGAAATTRGRQGGSDPGDPDDAPLDGAGIPSSPGRPRQGVRSRSGYGDGGSQQPDQGQVPIRNLATFLGEAFGPPRPHPADDPRNNPYAEGGYDMEGVDDTSDQDNSNTSEGNNTRGPGPQPMGPGAFAGGAGGDQALNLLFSMMNNAFGGGGQVFFGGGTTGAANMGDFAWGEQSFQNILNELMEQAAGRAGPQPATEEIINELPQTKVTQEILNLDTIKDCPICQSDYELDEELLTLPCRHAFHPECIKQWLTTSGTCPVCRYALVPQPTSETQVNEANPAVDAPGTPSASEQPPSVGEAPRRPVPTRRPTSTSRIPDIEGSRLPGSFPIPTTPSRRSTMSYMSGSPVVAEERASGTDDSAPAPSLPPVEDVD